MKDLPYNYNSEHMQIEDSEGNLLANMIPGPSVDKHGKFIELVCNSHTVLKEENKNLNIGIESIADMYKELKVVNVELQEALDQMIQTHGMHGPCNQHNCSDCRNAYDKARAILIKSRKV